MEFVPKLLRYIIVTASLLSISNTSPAQVVCETGYFSDYSANRHLWPASITTLHNGQQVVTGQTGIASDGRRQGMVARISETGDVLWSKVIDPGEHARLDGMLETANGKYIIYGNLYSAGDPDGRIWLLCLDQAGNMQWSRVIEKLHPGAEKLYSLMELPDGDLVGTFNIADSSSASRPVVFRLRDNGTLRWAREYVQEEAVGFNSLSFANGIIYSAGFQQVGKKKALIMLLDAATGDILERRYPAYFKRNSEQEAAFIQVFNNRISYTIDFRETVQQIDLFATVFVQTSADNATVFGTQKSGLAPDGAHVRIKRTQYNDFMIMRNWNYQSQMINHSQFGQINWSRRLNRYAYTGETHTGFDTANGGGGVSVGHYNSYLDNLSHMKIVRLTSRGNGGSCTDYGFTFHSDTINLVHENFNWSGIPAKAEVNLLSTGPISISSFVLLKNDECHTSECTDLAALEPGCNKTMMVEYGTPNRSQLSDVVALGDGSRLAVGHNGYFPWVLKLKENGDVDWSRFYNQHNYTGEFKKVIRLTSNTVLIAGNISSTVNHGSGTANYLLKIDNSGNILESQTLFSYGSSEVADLVPTDDGGFILVEVGIYGFPPIYNFVTRYDANMQVVWKKRIDVFAVDPISRSTFVSNGKIYIGHDYYPQSWRNYVGILKMDLGTGNFEWSRIYEVSGDDSPLRFNRIVAVKDTVYGFVNQWRTDGTRLIMLRIDQQGQFVDGKSVGGFNLVQPFSYTQWDISRPTVTLTPELDFVAADLITTAAGQALNISRFTNKGEMVWSRNYHSYNNHTVFNIRPHALGYQMVGRVGVSAGQLDRNFSNSFFMKTDSVGKLTLAPAGECAPVDAAFTSVPLNINSLADTRNIEGVSDNDWLKKYSLDVFAIPTPVDATLSCHRQSDCNPVTLGMIGDICQVNQPIRFYLQNNNCGSLAKWKFDSSYFDELNRKPDTLTLMPKRSGASQISADVENDCTSRELSIPVSLAVFASSLELGQDTVICSNNKLSLRAGQGFQSYTWNDGSTNSDLVVTEPGKYFVRVKDFCGNEASDTVLVSNPNDWFNVTGPLSKCNTDSILLTVPNTFRNVAWSPNAFLQANGNTAIVFPIETSKISVKGEWLPGCVVMDTVEIKVLHSPSIELGNLIDICYNDSITIAAPVGFSTYTWNTGESTNQISVRDAGPYNVSALYSNGCSSRDTVIVQKRAFKFPQLGPDQSFCQNEPGLLNPGNYSKYIWSTGATTAQLLIDKAGLYSVTVTDKFGCNGADTIQVRSILEPPANYLPEALQFCPGQEISIIPSITFSKYQWSTGSGNSSIRVKDTGEYILNVVDFNGCSGADSVRVRIKPDCPQSIHFPNAFTPNGDGLNDGFAPVIKGIVTKYQFEIFNRWGERLFFSNVPNQEWDGRIKGIVQASGGLVWKCSFQFPGEVVQKKSGTVILLR